MTTSKPYSHSGEKGMTTSPNTMSDEELQVKIVEIIDAINNANEANSIGEITPALFEGMMAEVTKQLMQLIKQHREAYALEENKNGFFAACGVCGVENTEKAEEYYRMYRAKLREKVGK